MAEEIEPLVVFETFRRNGVQYLATRKHLTDGSAWHVIDQFGTNYGSWWTVKKFREQLNKGEVAAVGGKATLSVRVLPEDM